MKLKLKLQAKHFIQILLLTSFLLTSSLSLADKKPLTEIDLQKIAVKLSAQVAEGGYKLLTIEQLKTMIDNKEDFILIDAHPKREFVAGYIDGAINFGFQSKHVGEWNKDLDIDGGATQKQFRDILGDDLGKKIVVYCGFTKCGRSHNAAWWMKFMGYTNVYRVPGGITGWQDAGHPYKVLP